MWLGPACLVGRHHVTAAAVLREEIDDPHRLLRGALAPAGLHAVRLREFDVHAMTLERLREVLAHPIVDLGKLTQYALDAYEQFMVAVGLADADESPLTLECK